MQHMFGQFRCCLDFSPPIKIILCLFFFSCQVPAAAVQGSKNFHFSIYGKKNNAKVSDDVSYIRFSLMYISIKRVTHAAALLDTVLYTSVMAVCQIVNQYSP